MSDVTNHRLFILRVLVLSLFIALLGRLFTMQVVNGAEYQSLAADSGHREVVVPATRGLILDSAGRVVLGNRMTPVVSISGRVLAQMPDKGESVLSKLAPLLGTTVKHLRARISICGTLGAAKAPVCWNGSPYQPIPVATDVTVDTMVRIMERNSEFPGVTAAVQSVRDVPKPLGVNLAHVLGYLGPVNDQELAARKGTDQELQRTDLIGRAGLEAQYDNVLRGTPGLTTLSIDRNMAILGTINKTSPVPGSYLIMTIDSGLQTVVENEVRNAFNRARSNGHPADGAAAVVIDVKNGNVLAMASYPTYDPAIWLDGVSTREYKSLTSKTSNQPLVSRAIQGQYVPASTFKAVTTLAAASVGLPLASGTYPCPSSIMIGNREMKNHESHAAGNISLKRAIEISCNTVFYGIGYNMWLKDGGLSPHANAKDPIETMAIKLGLGSKTGIDLPSESAGHVGGRAFKIAQYAKMKDIWCFRADSGYPEVAKRDPVRAQYLKDIAKENCTDGDKYRGGDAANLSIGQGDTVVTPLQMAMTYAAVANGGTVFVPHVVKAVVSADGKTVSEVKPEVKSRVKLKKSAFAFLRNALAGVVENGTAAGTFAGWPQNQIAVAGKTGTGQASGNKDDTAWFASFAPANKPRYAVVVMVSQGGLGGSASAPSVRKIYEALFGVTGHNVNPADSVLVSGKPTLALPFVSKSGKVTPLAGVKSADEVLKRRYGIGS
jgi:penicillin-binding protein 2